MSFKVIKDILKSFLYWLWTQSLRSAAREQKLENLKKELSNIVPDITDQYSNFKINNPFLNEKVRNLHAFQMSIIGKVIKSVDSPIVVDIGDSSGTHLQYIAGLYSNKRIRALSVNVDIKAVERIKTKGLEAVHARAEDLQHYDVNADIFLCLETLEHLMNPSFFLHELSSKTDAQYLIVTVPYLRKSRVGVHHIRGKTQTPANPENTHIFELSPEDWKLLMLHSGWTVVYEQNYLQYPKRKILRIMQSLWRKFDFEGFCGMILKRDDCWSKKYNGW